jgi:hypothetical protein
MSRYLGNNVAFFRRRIWRHGYGKSHIRTPSKYPPCGAEGRPEIIKGAISLAGTVRALDLQAPLIHRVVIAAPGVAVPYSWAVTVQRG